MRREPNPRWTELALDLREQLAAASDTDRANLQIRLDQVLDLMMRDLRSCGRVPHTPETLRELEERIEAMRHEMTLPIPKSRYVQLQTEAEAALEELVSNMPERSPPWPLSHDEHR